VTVAQRERTEPAQIGPNAIVRTLEALRERIGEPATLELLEAAGLQRYALESPATMVPEDHVIALYQTLRGRLNAADANAVARVAGLKTADYLLANRIPAAARTVLRLLPPRLASPMLLSSISKHTWTFAGSGTVQIREGPPPRIVVADCPICRGTAAGASLCAYYAGTFEGLFRSLVSRKAAVAEVACAAQGAPACTFEIRW
jgi:divinyl protochlorophyllide a 8-vinyl-reductase